MLFAMLAARALALMRLGRFDEAADWALRRPHGRTRTCTSWRSPRIAWRWPNGAMPKRVQFAAADPAPGAAGYSEADYLTAFRFSPDAEALMRRGAKVIWS